MSNDKFNILLMNSYVHRVGDLRYLWWRQKNAGYPRVPTELTKYKHIEWVRKLHIYCVEKPLKNYVQSETSFHTKIYVAMMENMIVLMNSYSLTETTIFVRCLKTIYNKNVRTMSVC